MSDEEFESLTRVVNAYANAQQVCDPIDYLKKQKTLLYAIAQHFGREWAIESHKRNKKEEEDA